MVNKGEPNPIETSPSVADPPGTIAATATEAHHQLRVANADPVLGDHSHF